RTRRAAGARGRRRRGPGRQPRRHPVHRHRGLHPSRLPRTARVDGPGPAAPGRRPRIVRPRPGCADAGRDRVRLGGVVTGVVLAVLAGAGVFLLYTRFALGRRRLLGSPAVLRRRDAGSRTPSRWLAEVGIDRLRVSELGAALALLFTLGLAGGLVVFGGVLPALVLGVFAAGLP